MSVKVVVGRLDDSKTIEVSDDCTVAQALRTGGYTKSENEKVQDLDDNEYVMDDIVENGTGYYLVQQVKSGCDE